MKLKLDSGVMSQLLIWRGMLMKMTKRGTRRCQHFQNTTPKIPAWLRTILKVLVISNTNVRFAKSDKNKQQNSSFNCWRHLKHLHKEEFAKIEETKATLASRKDYEPVKKQQKIDAFFQTSSQYKPNSFKKKQLDQALIEMIVTDLNPLSVVEKPGFVNFIQQIDPKYKLPSRRVVSESLIPKYYNGKLKELQSSLEDVEFVSLTTDAWSSINKTSFLNVSAHFWDQQKKDIESKMLQCQEFPGHHTGIAISKELKKIFGNVQPNKKSFCLYL